MATENERPAMAPEPADLRSSALRTLDFERTYLRRRWAAYYAVWSVALLILLGGPHFAYSAIASRVGTFGAYLTFTVVDVATIGFAVPVAVWVVRRGDRTFDLRGALVGRTSALRGEMLLRVGIVAAAVAGLVAGAFLFGLASLWTTVIPLFAFAFLTYRHLACSFRPIPPEGWAAVAAVVAANLVTLLSPAVPPYSGLPTLAWVAAIGIWAVCAGLAWFALAPDEEAHG